MCDVDFCQTHACKNKILCLSISSMYTHNVFLTCKNLREKKEARDKGSASVPCFDIHSTSQCVLDKTQGVAG